ncbi:MAG: filamentous hemagglutinin N-terminal domain-containing protein, partial [Gammaproteobacteria bacterium]
VINWSTFNIASGETTQFIQPSSQSIALNRIDATQGASSIFGQLSANGQVWLINPAGVFFQTGSQVDVAGLIASTANISDANFLAGNYHFTNGQGAVINAGNIRASEGGFIALVAPGVENSGVIQANLGQVILAAGKDFTVDFYGDNLIHFDATGAATAMPTDQNGQVMRDAIKNTGTIVADGGKVMLTAKVAQGIVENVINTSGHVQANSVSVRNGEIILSGGSTGVVNVSGTIKASGQKGGKIKITGEKVGLFDHAQVIATGDSGGGEILIGGNAYGIGPEQNAAYTYIGSDTVIDASAINHGHGGTVVVWSDLGTQFYGDISARGGLQSGNGGWIETSGKAWLNVTGIGDASAPNGLAGTWVLDPYNVTITAATFANTSSGTDPITWTPSADHSTILNTSIQSQLDLGSNVLIVTTGAGTQAGDITVSSSITTSALTTRTLTLQAENNIIFTSGADITSMGGALNIVLNSDSDANGAGAIQLTGVTLTSNGGDITLGGGINPLTDFAVGSGSLTTGIFLDNAKLLAGGGNVTLHGKAFGGGRGGSHHGIRIYNGSEIITAGTGVISLSGEGGSGSSQNNAGVQLNSAFINSTGTGSINITGTGGTGNSNNAGVQLNSAFINSTGTGSINITGTGGTGNSNNAGVQLNSAFINSTGTGSINITGTG